MIPKSLTKGQQTTDGYLRLDVDQAGYDFWLDVLNNYEPGNYGGMVCSFIHID